MRRFLAGFALASFLALPLGATAGKVINVTTPMTQDLDGGGHNIVNVTNFQSATGASIGGAGTTSTEDVLVDTFSQPYNVAVSRFVCAVDPSVAPGIDRNPGSECVRRIGGNPGQPWTGTAELWFKTGPNPTDWQRVALAP